MMMDRVDFSDPRFVFCKDFLIPRNYGKGQRIELRVNAEKIKGFLKTKVIEGLETIDGHCKVFKMNGESQRTLNAYVMNIEKEIKKMAKESGTVYFGFSTIGSWEGYDRYESILKFESKLAQFKRVHEAIAEWDIDFNSFYYIDTFMINNDGTLQIKISKRGTVFHNDINKLIKFLNMLGYEESRPVYSDGNQSMFFDGINVDEFVDSKDIWNFL